MTLPVERYGDLDAWSLPDERGLQVRGRRLATGRPVIHFLHGNGFCGGVYWPFLRRLTTHYDLVTQDIEGHGESDAPPDGRFSGVAALSGRIASVLDRLALPSPLIGMGHSFGAALTLRQAVMHPERFSRIVLLDPILLPTPDWLGVKLLNLLRRNPMANAALRRRPSWTDADAAFQRLNGRGIYAGWEEGSMRGFVEHATRDTPEGRALICAPRIEADIFSSPLYAWRDLARVRVPVHIVCGRGSYSFFDRTLARIRARRPDIDIRLEEGGHCFMLERPDAVAAGVLGILR